ncbi:group II intron maturase-specific domain-containing protein [Rossellomorea vietnamensis]|uniref:group II intron maturase-specific domain-containing protein n=1 Tax=Rossellomorea vietnamensis TaxID=218284 RepID=UPI003984FD6C|nr:hypothetical protein [Rossellomorea vietnamensis]
MVREWGNYFRKGNVKTHFRTLDSWIRRRLRMVHGVIKSRIIHTPVVTIGD